MNKKVRSQTDGGRTNRLTEADCDGQSGCSQAAARPDLAENGYEFARVVLVRWRDQ